jgi:hypothetical protein
MAVTAARANLYLPESPNIADTNFCLRLKRTQGHNEAGNIRSIEKSNDLIGNGTLDLPACNILPQPNMPPRAPVYITSTGDIMV